MITHLVIEVLILVVALFIGWAYLQYIQFVHAQECAVREAKIRTVEADIRRLMDELLRNGCIESSNDQPTPITKE